MRAQYWRVQTKTKRQFGSMIILGTAAMLCAIHLVQNMPSPVTFTQLLDMISASTHSAPWVTRHLFVCIRLYFLHCWQAILFRAQRPGRVVCWVEWCRCFRNVRGNRSSWRCYGENPFFLKKVLLFLLLLLAMFRAPLKSSWHHQYWHAMLLTVTVYVHMLCCALLADYVDVWEILSIQSNSARCFNAKTTGNKISLSRTHKRTSVIERSE